MAYARLTLATAMAACNLYSACLAAEQARDFAIDVIGDSTIVAISDGDFVAQSYANGRLAPRDEPARDLLTLLSVREGQLVRSTLPVSNSVTAAPEILKLAPDGKIAFVTERLGERAGSAEMVRDLPPGRRLFAVDVSDRSAPKLADTIEVGAFPEALAIDPHGQRVAVVSNTATASLLQVAGFDSGRFRKLATFDLASFGLAIADAQPRGGITATNVNWHPSGRFIAVNINTQNRVVFFEVSERDGVPALRPWGNPVETGTDPFVGRFTPDGRHYITSDWGRNFAATTLESRLPERPSSISIVRLATPDGEPQAARHERIASADTDLSAEGLAVSPDGRLIATINMRGTALPPDSPRFQRQASVTLLTFDPATGEATKVADYPLDGMLPEGGVFDPAGRYFYATVFHGHERKPDDSGAGLEVFRVADGERPSLKRIGRIPMPRGVHHVDIVR